MKCCSLIERFLLIFQVPRDRCPRSHWGNGSRLHCELMKETDLGLPEGVILQRPLRRLEEGFYCTGVTARQKRNAYVNRTHTNTQMRDITRKGWTCTGHLWRFDRSAREKCGRCLEHLNGSSKHSCVQILLSCSGCIFLKSQSKSATLNFGSIHFVFHILMALTINYCGGTVMVSDVMVFWYMGVFSTMGTFGLLESKLC